MMRHLAQPAHQQLEDRVMGRRPDRPGCAPGVEDIADEIDPLGLVPVEKVEHPFRLAAGGAEMQVREEQAAIAAARHRSARQASTPRWPAGAR